MILCFQPNEAHISEVAIGAQGIGVVSEYYHRFICLGRWNCVYSSTVRAPDCDSGGGGSIPPKHQLFFNCLRLPGRCETVYQQMPLRYGGTCDL